LVEGTLPTGRVTVAVTNKGLLNDFVGQTSVEEGLRDRLTGHVLEEEEREGRKERRKRKKEESRKKKEERRKRKEDERGKKKEEEGKESEKRHRSMNERS